MWEFVLPLVMALEGIPGIGRHSAPVGLGIFLGRDSVSESVPRIRSVLLTNERNTAGIHVLIERPVRSKVVRGVRELRQRFDAGPLGMGPRQRQPGDDRTRERCDEGRHGRDIVQLAAFLDHTPITVRSQLNLGTE